MKVQRFLRNGIIVISLSLSISFNTLRMSNSVGILPQSLAISSRVVVMTCFVSLKSMRITFILTHLIIFTNCLFNLDCTLGMVIGDIFFIRQDEFIFSLGAFLQHQCLSIDLSRFHKIDKFSIGSCLTA